MLQIAVFVDAGYAFAQGAALLKGRKQRRELIRLSETQVLEQLAATAGTVAPDARLLRSTGMTAFSEATVPAWNRI